MRVRWHLYCPARVYYDECVRKFVIAVITFLFLAAPSVFAAPSYSLVAPSTGITRGQNVQFTIRIDTAGESVTNTTAGLRYDTKYLKYVGVQAGEAATSVTGTESTTGEIILNGTSNNFSGEGAYAHVTFTIVADAPGGTQICSVFTPSNSPSSNASTTSTQSRPSTLPQSGAAETTLLAMIAATFAISGGFLLRRHA